MEIDDTSAMVTGGASGLGLASATELVRRGARVTLVDLPGSAGEQAADALGSSARFIPADITSETAVAEAVRAAEEISPLRIVVNCAGVIAGRRLVDRSGPIPLADFERVLRINLMGTVNVMRLAAAAMISNPVIGEERGVIVNTASVAAYEGQIGQTAYASSKAAIAGLTLPAARELADSAIRVMAIAPGIFETPMVATMTEEVRASLGHQVPHPRRLGRPQEFARLVTHIVENPMLNGEVVRLDGAIRMGPR